MEVPHFENILKTDEKSTKMSLDTLGPPRAPQHPPGTPQDPPGPPQDPPGPPQDAIKPLFGVWRWDNFIDFK